MGHKYPKDQLTAESAYLWEHKMVCVCVCVGSIIFVTSLIEPFESLSSMHAKLVGFQKLYVSIGTI